MAVPVVLAAAGTTEIAASGAGHRITGVVSFLLGAAVLIFARAAPVTVPPFVAAVYALTPLAGFDVSPYATWNLVLAAACFGAGRYASGRSVVAGASVAVTLAVAYSGLRWLTSFQPGVLFGLIMSFGPFALGIALRIALERERSAAAVAEQAWFAAAAAGDRAVREERERLAVELHDALAHAVGEMLVQASTAADLVHRDPDEAGRRLAGVAETGRAGLAETGRLVRVLRDDEEERVEGDRIEGEAALPEAAVVRGRTVDVLIAALLAIFATAEIVVDGFRPLPGMLGCYWLACAALLGRRAVPTAMPPLVVTVLLAGRLFGLPVDQPASSTLVIGLACYTAGRHCRRTVRGFAGTLAADVLMFADAAARAELTGDAALMLAFSLVPWLVGTLLRLTLERTRAHAAAAERARLEHAEQAERAAAAERRRVARELHDVLAASLSVMSVQAALAAELVTRDPAAGAVAVGHVQRAGRAALADVGRLLRLSRSGQPGTEPLHGLADLTTLVAGYVHAGLHIDLDTEGTGALPPGVDSSLYRLVQEALTNALKHAPGAVVRVRVRRAGTAITVEVVNDPPPSTPRTVVAGGHGLLGLRERIALLGGRFDAGRTAAGGFMLAASIPLVVVAA